MSVVFAGNVEKLQRAGQACLSAQIGEDQGFTWKSKVLKRKRVVAEHDCSRE
ncbi:MAG: hypothetical protein ACE5KC_00205 [Candidatus Bathyarchaeia archaeon]